MNIYIYTYVYIYNLLELGARVVDEVRQELDPLDANGENKRVGAIA